MTGPLSSLRVVEFAGLGPAPLAGQLLADLGAQVVVIDRVSSHPDKTDINRRGKDSVALNLKTDTGRAIARDLINESDILIEGFRPGVMERLGLGPEDCHDRLIYGRMTGWGQTGPWAARAGHDINYLAMTGALHAMGAPGRPPEPPLNLVADYGGGTMFLVFGLLAAVIERGISGKGQVVDAAMIDGVSAMMGMIHGFLARGDWSLRRGENWLDGSSHFYRCYACSDGKFLSVGALEPQFYAQFLDRIGVTQEMQGAQTDASFWPVNTATLTRLFKTRTRDEWVAIFEGCDACIAPVLDFAEARLHPVNTVRDLFREVGGVSQAAPAPRFGRSHPADPTPPKPPGADSATILARLGYGAEEISALRAKGVLT